MDPLTAIAEAFKGITDLVGHFFPDATEEKKGQLAAAMQAQQNAFALMLAQIQASAGLPWWHFRNLAGLVCVSAMAVDFVIRPLAAGFWKIPNLDVSELMPLLLGLLGLGGMHMYERTK